jgi:hypothetical protein
VPSMISGGSLTLLLLAASSWAAGTKINGVTYSNQGNAVAPVNTKDALPPEQALRLKKLFLFPTIDDLSGALAPKLDEKLVELFSRDSRFELIRDPQVVKALSPDENTYYKAAQNQSVHMEAAKVTGADTTVLLRTHNVGRNTQMNLEFRDARGNLLFSEEGSIPGSSPMDTRWGLIEKLYKGMLARLPFEGAVTGRTANTITVDLGMGALQRGEEIQIARIVSVQRHPLLGTVVGTDYVRTGRAKVTTVDRVLSFAEVQEESAGEKIAPGQKILQARANLIRRGSLPADEEAAENESQDRPAQKNARGITKQPKKDEDPLDDRLKGDFDEPKARFGQVGGNLYYGSLSHSQSASGTPTDYSGTGIGGDAGGELWVTKNWIFTAVYGFHNATLNGASGSAGTVSWSEFGVAGGYRIFPETLAEGMELTGSVGYQSMSFNIPANETLLLGGKKYAGLILRADAEIHFMDKQKISAGFGIQPFASLTDLGTSLGMPGSASVIAVHLGWNRQLTSEIWMRIGMRYDVANGSYENSANTVSDKRFAIGPGIYYLF